MAGNHIKKNSVIGVIQLLLTAVLTFISIPIFIHKLGLELYGIFAIVSVIGNLNLLTNFGLNGALLVYIAKQGKCRESDHDIAVTQIIMVLIMAIFCTLAVIFRGFIIEDLFSIPQQFAAESEKLLVFLVFSNALLLIGQTYTAVFDAMQKIYLTNIAQFIYSLIYWGGMIAVVSFGGSLSGIGLIVFIAALIWLFIILVIFKRKWGKLDLINLKKEFKITAWKQLSYGTKIYFSGLAGFMFEPLSKILLSNFIGLNAVALFEIGAKIRGQINGILTTALYPIFPFIAKTPTSEKLHRKLFDLSKKIQLIVIPIGIIMMFTFTILLKLWLGPNNLDQISIFVITMASASIFLVPPSLLIYQYLAAKNMADKNIWVQMSAVIINIILFFAFLDRFGIYAILISNTLALISSYIICNYYQYKYLGAKFQEERTYYTKLIAYGLTCTIACVFIRHFVSINLYDLIIYPFIIGITFILFVRNQKLITNNDIEFYFGTNSFLKKTMTNLLIH